MALNAYQRRTERARSKGYSSYYYLRQAQSVEKLKYSAVDERVERGLQYKKEFGWKTRRAAKEAGIAPQRLAAIEREIESHSEYRVPITHGNIRMMSFVRNRGIVYVELDDANASLNGSYLNYVRWMIYQPGKIGKKSTRRMVEGSPYLDTGKLINFNNMLNTKGIVGQTFHAINVYDTHMEGGKVVMNTTPSDSNIDLQWELFSKTLKQYDDQLTGDFTPVYMRR